MTSVTRHSNLSCRLVVNDIIPDISTIYNYMYIITISTQQCQRFNDETICVDPWCQPQMYSKDETNLVYSYKVKL